MTERDVTLSVADLIAEHGDLAAIRAAVLVSRAAADADTHPGSFYRDMLLFWERVAVRLWSMGYSSECWAVVPQGLSQPTLADAVSLARDRDQADVEANGRSVAAGQPMAVVSALSLDNSRASAS